MNPRTLPRMEEKKIEVIAQRLAEEALMAGRETSYRSWRRSAHKIRDVCQYINPDYQNLSYYQAMKVPHFLSSTKDELDSRAMVWILGNNKLIIYFHTL